MPDVRAVASGYCRRWRRAGVGMGATVAIWWLLAGAAVSLMVPAPVASALKVAAGLPAHVNLPGQVPAYPSFPIPVERAAFDLAQRGYREGNERMIDDAFSASEWLTVTHGQLVTVVAMDGDVVQVELLDGPYAGRHGWLNHRQLAP